MAAVEQTPLPIDPLLPEIVAALRRSSSVVLEAPPGAGKTTRVPRALLESGLVPAPQSIVVLQPRRLATRMAAARVAEELGERPGQTVGYQVRFEDVSGPGTRLRFLTEGILARRLLTDPELKDVGMVVLDEFHERHLATDVALAMLRRLQLGRRPDLKLVVMSATLDAEPIAAFLGGCPRLRSEGKRFEVSLEYLPAPDDRPLDQLVAGALKRLVASGLEGHVLAFLPGAAEIRRAREACEEFASRQGFELHALHGDLPAAEQDRAVRPSRGRKLILSTNVAETSVTIDGVGAVIDSGLARVASHSPWTGLPTLKVARVSKASATQRAGRAGRTREGRCMRLFTRADFDGRADHDAPDIRRLDLTETVLQLRSGGVTDLGAFSFFEAPPPASLEAADTLLHLLGAMDPDGRLTAIGQRMLAFPVHPRLARLIVEGERRGVASEAALVAALLGERDLRLEARASVGQGRGGGRATVSGPSDVLELVERFREAERADFAHGRLRGMNVDAGAAQAVDRVRRQLTRLVERGGMRPATAEGMDEALLLATLAGFPDRVGRRRRPRAPEVVLFGGGSATLSDASVVTEAELMVCVDAEERASGVMVRLASQVEPEWLLDLFPDAISERDQLVWNASAERVDRLTGLSYGNLTLEETRSPAPPSEQTTRVLAEAALAAGLGRFATDEALEQWTARVELLSRTFPDAGFPSVDTAGVLRALCEGRRSFAELREASPHGALLAQLSPEQSRLLATMAPERVTLPGGRQVRVQYQPGKPPFIESRLQDFFGMRQGPSVCGGRLPLVLHLLAPNQRAVQVTTDLAGFWDRHYPAIRKELMRKYPRHAWPEDPLTAQPPAPRRG